MASFNHKESDDRKASGLTELGGIPGGSTDGGDGRSNASRGGKGVPGMKKKRGWVTVLLDILLLVVLAGLIVGGWFGYRALREVYAPEWEVREMIYRVELKGIDPNMVEYGEDGRPVYTNKSIWSSDRTDADHLGTVVDVQTELVSGAGGVNTLNLYLTVKANAYYREGEGYRMGATMLLAGYEGLFRLEGTSGGRVDGLMAEGMIISLHEASEEASDTDSGTLAPSEPDEAGPEAQG